MLTFWVFAKLPLQILQALDKFNRQNNSTKPLLLVGAAIETKMDLNKLVEAVEAKTGEKIVSVTGRKPKLSNWNKLKCWLGFHNYDIKSGQGFFTDNQCTRCWSFRSTDL